MTHRLTSVVRICAFLVMAAVVSNAHGNALAVWRSVIYPVGAAAAFALALLFAYRFARVRSDPLAILLSEGMLYTGCILLLLHISNAASYNDNAFTFGPVVVAAVTALRLMMVGVLMHVFVYLTWRTFRVDM